MTVSPHDCHIRLRSKFAHFWHHLIHTFSLYMQRQTNGSDCGLFALAFATALCEKKKPEQIIFEKTSMRLHLLKCLEQENMTAFPSRQVQQSRVICKKETIEIYCKCCTQEEGRMVQCEICLKWFHDTCVNTKTQVWNKKDSKWFCEKCTKNLKCGFIVAMPQKYYLSQEKLC